MRLALGLYITGQGQSGSDIIITAAVTPVASPIANGAALSTMTDWATFASTGNYSSTAAAISTVVAKLDGVTRAGSYTPADDNYTLTFLVTDASANERTFNAGTLVVGAGPSAVPDAFADAGWSVPAIAFTSGFSSGFK